MSSKLTYSKDWKAAKKTNYNVHWTQRNGHQSNISIMETSDERAIRSADEEDARLQLTNSSRTIYDGARLVHSRP